MDLERGPGQGTMGEFLEYAVIWFPGGSNGKESACLVRDLGSIPGLRRSPGGEHGNPLRWLSLLQSLGFSSFSMWALEL